MTALAPLWFDWSGALSVGRCEACNQSYGPYVDLHVYEALADHSAAVHGSRLLPRIESERAMFSDRGEPRAGTGWPRPNLCLSHACWRPGIDSWGLCGKHAQQQRAAEKRAAV